MGKMSASLVAFSPIRKEDCQAYFRVLNELSRCTDRVVVCNLAARRLSRSQFAGSGENAARQLKLSVRSLL